jgi:hypothetical protein
LIVRFRLGEKIVRVTQNRDPRVWRGLCMKSRSDGTAAGANRPAVFTVTAINRFQVPKVKEWKILLFERLALIL